MENIVFSKIVVDESGNVIQNAEGDIQCEVFNDKGDVLISYLSAECLKDFGLIGNGNCTETTNSNSRPTTLTLPNDAPLDVPSTSALILPAVDGHCTPEVSQLWKSPKCPTESDHLATSILLQLRKKYENEFNDKKTAKNILWSKIAKEMNNMGYYVGAEKNEGREKVRQKFANLQTSYQKYQEKRRRTGEGAVDKPPFYIELDEILGAKHKVCPPYILDSECATPKTTSSGLKAECTTPKRAPPSGSNNNADELSGCGPANENKPPNHTATEHISTPSHFALLKKSVRPTKEKVSDMLKEMHQENLAQRKQEFSTIVELIREEGQQRHQEVMAILEVMKQKFKSTSTSKRKRNDEDSD